MNILPVIKFVGSGAVLTTIVGTVRYVRKRFIEKRERIILDALEQSPRPLSVSTIENTFRGHALRGADHMRYLPTIRPGGDPCNEADHIRAKIPSHVRFHYWWRVKIRREIPTEQKVRDILRSLKSRGFVEFVGDDSWRLFRR